MEWIKTKFPDGTEETLGFWIVDCEQIIIRNFLIENGQCFVYDFNGDWIPAPFPNYWKYCEDMPNWMSNNEEGE